MKQQCQKELEAIVEAHKLKPSVLKISKNKRRLWAIYKKAKRALTDDYEQLSREQKHHYFWDVLRPYTLGVLAICSGIEDSSDPVKEIPSFLYIERKLAREGLLHPLQIDRINGTGLTIDGELIYDPVHVDRLYKKYTELAQKNAQDPIIEGRDKIRIIEAIESSRIEDLASQNYVEEQDIVEYFRFAYLITHIAALAGKTVPREKFDAMARFEETHHYCLPPGRAKRLSKCPG
ncbi:MAG: hypothetical protein QW331_04595 [Candidatus Woesearchaeota archaeon]